MYNHEPVGYDCPFCRIIQAVSIAHPDNAPPEIVHTSERATAFLALGRWAKNPVDVLIVPNEHFENLYDLPVSYAQPLHQVTRAVACALKSVYDCQGVSTRQHNEMAGDQDVWHYHVHVTPRFNGDEFHKASRVDFPEPQRLQQAQLLRRYIQVHEDELFRI